MSEQSRADEIAALRTEAEAAEEDALIVLVQRIKRFREIADRHYAETRTINNDLGAYIGAMIYSGGMALHKICAGQTLDGRKAEEPPARTKALFETEPEIMSAIAKAWMMIQANRVAHSSAHKAAQRIKSGESDLGTEIKRLIKKVTGREIAGVRYECDDPTHDHSGEDGLDDDDNDPGDRFGALLKKTGQGVPEC